MQPSPHFTGDPVGGWLTVAMGFVAFILVLRMLTMPKRPPKGGPDSKERPR